VGIKIYFGVINALSNFGMNILLMRWFLFLLLLLPGIAEAQIITTFAGNGSDLHTGDGGLATSAGIAYNVSGNFDKTGNYYFSEVANGNRICKIDTSGIITTIAGTGIGAYSGDGGLATAAKIYLPQGLIVDTNSNIYFCDAGNNRIRKIDNATGIISTIAGNGIAGYFGDGSQATAAMINDPWDILLDKRGNLYFSEVNNYRIRKVNISSGIISTYAGNGLSGYTGDGGLADTARIAPMGICMDDTGNLYIADGTYCRIRKVDTTGIISTFAGNGIAGNNGDGGNALIAQITPSFLRADRYGNIYMATSYLVNKVRIINTIGLINTFAGIDSAGFSGDGGPAVISKLNKPEGLSFDACGNLYIADDFNHRIRKVIIDTSCSLHSDSTSLGSYNIYLMYPLCIYPNPVTTELNITSFNKITQLTITNLIGQQVYTHVYNKESVQVNVARLPGGIYFVKINGSEVRRFVKE